MEPDTWVDPSGLLSSSVLAHLITWCIVIIAGDVWKYDLWSPFLGHVLPLFWTRNVATSVGFSSTAFWIESNYSRVYFGAVMFRLSPPFLCQSQVFHRTVSDQVRNSVPMRTSTAYTWKSYILPYQRVHAFYKPRGLIFILKHCWIYMLQRSNAKRERKKERKWISDSSGRRRQSKTENTRRKETRGR